MFQEQKGTTKSFWQCDRDFAEVSGELPGAICINKLTKTLVLPRNALELFTLVLWVRFFFLGFVSACGLPESEASPVIRVRATCVKTP